MSTQSWHERLWRLLRSAYDSPTGALRVSHDRGSLFGEFVTASRTPIIELNSSYGTSLIRDIVQTTGTGMTGAFEGAIRLSTGATAGSTAIVSTAELGRYIPGYAAEFGIGVRIPTRPTGDHEILWGGRGPAGNNGFLWGYDANGLFITILRGGVRIATFRQEEWNQDRMDGNGLSGFDLDVADGLVFQVEYTWYGHGLVTFGVLGTIVDTEGRLRQTFLPCHHYRAEGETSIEKPNLRLVAENRNNTTAANVDMFVGGRQYSIVGEYRPKFRFSHAWRDSTNVNTTFTPLVSMRRKTDFSDRSLKLEGFELLTTQSSVLVGVFLNASLTGGTWVNPLNHTAAETAMEANVSATALTGGTLIWQSLVQGGGNPNQSAFDRAIVDFDVPDGQTLTLAARTISGTGSVISALRATEEWVWAALMFGGAAKILHQASGFGVLA